MRYAELLSAAGIVAGVSTVLAADPAPVISNNPPGGVAFAVIKSNDGALDAVVAVSTGENGEGVRVVMNINGNHALTGGPFMYHIHEKAVASSGDCASAGAHLDPTGRGENPGCDATKPETCQVGDLSGKWGNCQGLPGCSKTFLDKYLSLTPGTPAYLGDKSFVLHYPNKTRIACANFAYGPQGGPVASSTTASTPTSSSTPLSTVPPSVVPSTGTGAPGNGTVPPPASTPQAPPAPGAAISLNAMSTLTGFALAFLGFTLW